jgi:hypothetical protein
MEDDVTRYNTMENPERNIKRGVGKRGICIF